MASLNEELTIAKIAFDDANELNMAKDSLEDADVKLKAASDACKPYESSNSKSQENDDAYTLKNDAEKEVKRIQARIAIISKKTDVSRMMQCIGFDERISTVYSGELAKQGFSSIIKLKLACEADLDRVCNNDERINNGYLLYPTDPKEISGSYDNNKYYIYQYRMFPYDKRCLLQWIAQTPVEETMVELRMDALHVKLDTLEAQALAGEKGQQKRVEDLLKTFESRVADMVRVLVPMVMDTHSSSFPVAQEDEGVALSSEWKRELAELAARIDGLHMRLSNEQEPAKKVEEISQKRKQ
jgi:hypothetical protein